MVRCIPIRIQLFSESRSTEKLINEKFKVKIAVNDIFNQSLSGVAFLILEACSLMGRVIDWVFAE